MSKKQVFRISNQAGFMMMVPGLVALAVFLFVAYVRSGNLPEGSPLDTSGFEHVVWFALGSFYVALLIGWVLFYVNGREPRVARSASIQSANVFAVLAILLGLNAHQMSADNKAQAAFADLEEIAENFQRDIAINSDPNTPLSESATESSIERSAERMKKVASHFTGDDRIAMEIVAKKQASLAPLAKQYDEVMAPFWETPVIDMTTVDDQFELLERIALTSNAKVASYAVTTTLATYMGELELELRNAGVADDKINTVKQTFTPVFELRRDADEIEDELLSKTLDFLNFHMEHWDAWEYDPATQSVVYADPSQSEIVRAMESEINQLTERRHDAENRLLNHRKRMVDEGLSGLRAGQM